MTLRRTRRVIFQPRTSTSIQNGIHELVNTVRPTLGPVPRLVANAKTVTNVPELLDDGGTIARRIIQLKDPDADMGAMFLRHALWQVHEKVGDGTATTAVLFEAVFDEGLHYITNGGNAMVLRGHLEAGARLILEELDRKAIPVEGKEQLTKIAQSICYDASTAKLMGEIFDIIGEYGQMEIISGRGRDLEREYVEGMYWDGGIISRDMITNNAEQKTVLEDAAILITDLKFDQPQELAYFAEKVHKAGEKALVVMGADFSDTVKGLMMAVTKSPLNFTLLGVKTPGMEMNKRLAALEDLAILTGGEAIVSPAGQTLANATVQHLGHARRIWANKDYSGIVAGKGDPRRLRKHVANLRSAMDHTKDAEDRKRLQWRLGKLMGGSATLIIGANTETELEYRKEQAQRTGEALRAAIKEGVLPGGGMALMACRSVLNTKMHQAKDADERAAYRILAKAMEKPLRTIVANAGYVPEEVIADLRNAPSGAGFDALTGKIVDIQSTGILDVTSAQKTAVSTAIYSAALALTTDVLVHRKKPETSMNP